MRVACQATLKCYEAVFTALKAGMTQNHVSGLIGAAYSRLGFPGVRQRAGRRVHRAPARFDHARRRSAKAPSS